MSKYVLSLALALAACGTDTPSPEASGGASGVEIPTTGSPLIEVAERDAARRPVIEEGNEITVLNFWATWCGPCRIEFPDLMAYDAEMEDENVEVRFVSVDDAEMMDKVRAFLDEQGLEERSYVSPNNTVLAAEFGPRFGAALPTTLVMDSEGIVRGAHMGVVSSERIAELVAGVRDGSIDITTQL